MIQTSLARRLDRAGARFIERWLGGAARHNGNPSGIVTARFGDAVAIAATAHPGEAWINCVHALHDPGRIPAILRFYEELGISPRFELMEGIEPPPGFTRTEERSFFSGRPEPGPAPDGVVVRRVGRAEADLHAATHLEGFEVPLEARETGMKNLGHWIEEPRWLLYLAFIDGVVAGEATLQIDDGIGYLAEASTLPPMRGRGVQQALLHARIADARDAGCEYVASQTQSGSQSARNIERAGLSLAFTKSAWDRPG